MPGFLTGLALAPAAACSTFGVTLKMAIDAIQRGEAKAVVMGATDPPPLAMTVGGFYAARVISADGQVSKPLTTLRGTHVRLEALWNYEAPADGGDTHVAIVRGSRARVEILQGPEQKWRPELYVAPNRPAEAAAVKAAVQRRVAELAKARPGLTLEDEVARLRIGIPDRYRVGHEPHFAEVTERHPTPRPSRRASASRCSRCTSRCRRA